MFHLRQMLFEKHRRRSTAINAIYVYIQRIPNLNCLQHMLCYRKQASFIGSATTTNMYNNNGCNNSNDEGKDDEEDDNRRFSLVRMVFLSACTVCFASNISILFFTFLYILFIVYASFCFVFFRQFY